MKKLIIYLSLVLSVVLYSCQDKLDVEGLTTFPPTVLSSSPRVSIKKGAFELKAVLVTGPDAPLTSGTITLKDATGKQLYTVTKTLTGIKDSVIAKATDFNAAALELGSYKLEIKVVNAKGLSKTTTSDFKVALTQYPASNSKMYIAGEFNGWGAGELTLISDFTWEIKNVDLQGKAWKLKNTTDWTDDDWGDGDCDGLMTSKKADGGNKDTNCKYSGLVNIQFNDQTLKYTVKPAVNFKTSLSGLYVLGDFNNFNGSENKFQLTADNTWELAEIRLKPSNQFKFSESPFFKGKNYGDSGKDGVAAEFAANFNGPAADAFYKIKFNDLTLKYSITLVRYPYPDKTFLVGDASSAGWTAGSAIPFMKTADGKFEIYAYLTSGGGFKFLQNVKDWPGSWGKGADGILVQDGTGSNSNITIPADGFYKIEADYIAKTYKATKMTWAIIGDATPGGWDADTAMTFSGGSGSYKWSIDVTLKTGAFKFRGNGNWDYNYGDDGANKSLEAGGANINSPGPGTYHIELILDPVNGYKYTIQ